MQTNTVSTSAWFLLFTLALIWGSSFILIKYALFQGGEAALTGPEVGALRLVIACLCLLPITIKHRRWLSSHWGPLLVSGLIGNGIPAFLFGIAQTKIDSSLAGILNSVTPLFTLLTGVLLFNNKAQRIQFTGVLIGLIGTAVLIWSSSSPDSNSDPLYAGLVILSALCYAISMNTIKSYLQEVPTLAIAGLALLFAAVPSTAYLLLSDFPTRLLNEPIVQSAMIYTVLLAVLGTAFALILFNELLRTTTAVFSSSVTYLLPIVAIIWGVWDGEHVSTIQLVSTAIVLGGVVLVSKKGE